MTRFARDVRLIPIVLFATISLLALKVSGLVFDGGYTLAERLQMRTKPVPEMTASTGEAGNRRKNCRRSTLLGSGNVEPQ